MDVTHNSSDAIHRQIVFLAPKGTDYGVVYPFLYVTIQESHILTSKNRKPVF